MSKKVSVGRWVKCFSILFVLTDNLCYFPPTLFSSAYQPETTADLRHYNSHSQWSIITQNKTRAGHKNKHNISSVCEDCMALCKNCAIIFPGLPQKQKDKYVHFPNFSPISCCSLAFHFTLCFSLFIDETEEGGRRPLLTGTNLSVCVQTCVSYMPMQTLLSAFCVVGTFS